MPARDDTEAEVADGERTAMLGSGTSSAAGEALEQLPWEEARIFLREICTEVTDEDLEDFTDWAVAWHPGADTDPVTINGLRFDGIDSFDPLINPEGKILEQQHVAALRELEYASALAVVDLAEVAGSYYRAARVAYFDSERFTRRDLSAGEVLSSQLPEFRGRFNFSMNLTHGGWGVELRFDSADDEELEWALGEIASIKAQRLQEAQAYIASLDLEVVGDG